MNVKIVNDYHDLVNRIGKNAQILVFPDKKCLKLWFDNRNRLQSYS